MSEPDVRRASVRRLPVLSQHTAELPRAEPPSPSTPPRARHPHDGWQVAEPYLVSARGRRALRGVVRAVCPPEPAPVSDELYERVEIYVRRFMSYMHPLAAFAMWTAIVLVNWSPRFLFRSWRSLANLERSEAADIFHAVAESRFELLRTLMMGLRGIVLSGYFDQDEVHQALGYRPVPFLTERVRLRRRLLEPAHAH